jgi:biotin operon repressor
MKSFKSYVERRHIRNLFDGSDLILKNSKSDIFIQLADFIAGTLGHSFDELKKTNESRSFLNILQEKSLSFNFFPRKFSYQDFEESNTNDKFDSQIAELSYNRAIDFIETTKVKEQEHIDQINCVKLLLIYLSGANSKRFVPTWELVKHLNASRGSQIKEQYFRSKIIGQLRDKGVLIASSRDGYKLPTSTSDLKEFINHGRRIILPMAHRIKVTRDAIKLASHNEIDILESIDFQSLRELIEKMK